MLPKKELAKITEAKRKLNEKQKTLKAKVNKNHEDRVMLKGQIAKHRKDSVEDKAILRKLIAQVGPMLSDDKSDLRKLRQGILEAAAELDQTIMGFCFAREKLKKLQ
jgi:peptidoglycan hydrolase CwlO-like protein